ncbi:MAG: isochorismate synthase [Rhizobiaceae bacterium]
MSSSSFQLVSSDRTVSASGTRRTLPRGAAASLGQRVRAFFASQPGGPACVVGALPFDREAEDFLYQPEAISFDGKTAVAGAGGQRSGAAAGRWTVEAKPTARGYADAVARGLALMADSRADVAPLEKVVLSRSLTLATDRDLDPAALVRLLSGDASVTAFSVPLPGGAEPRLLVGATPELLVSKTGATVASHPLAGSARRGGDPVLDRQAGAALLASDKDRREHRAVVEAVLDTLSPYCSALGAPDGTTLRPTATMWHLGTRIVGRLKDAGVSAAELAAALHPTPAVCGLPRQKAAAVIRALEGYDREFYAGAVGWTDEAGDGEWHVAIRCAELCGNRIRLYAGAGIVEGSDPLAEVDETSAKFLPMLDALGIDEQGRPLKERAA